MRSLLPLAALLAGCAAPTLSVEQVVELDPLDAPAGIVDRAGGTSALWGDRSVWVFGDTALDAVAADGRDWRDNSWATTADLDASDGIALDVPTDTDGVPLEVLAPTADEQAYNDAHFGANCAPDDDDPCGSRRVVVPGPLVVNGDSALLFHWGLQLEPGTVGRGRGVGLALWSDPAAPAERLLVEGSPWMFPDDGDAPGTAAALHEGTVYSFGCAGLERSCKLLRAPVGESAQPDAWQWYDEGTTWLDTPDQADVLFTGGERMSLAWNEALERWLVVYSAPGEERVLLRHAEAVTGPWSEPVELFATEPGADDTPSTAGLHHPEYTDGTTLIVTYEQPTAPFEGTLRVLRVTLGNEAL